MHGRPDLATYEESHNLSYRTFSKALAAQLNRTGRCAADLHTRLSARSPAALFSNRQKIAVRVFSGTFQWPASCPGGMESHLIEIVRGLLHCRTIGFHIPAYIKNFCAFIREFLPEFRILPDERSVLHHCGLITTLIATPAGIDSAYWRGAGRGRRLIASTCTSLYFGRWIERTTRKGSSRERGRSGLSSELNLN